MNDDDDLGPTPFESSGDQTLPRSVVTKLIKDLTPPTARCSPEAQALIHECLGEFLQMLTAEANEMSSKDKKNTISEAHLTQALVSLGFERFAQACTPQDGAPLDAKAALRAEKKKSKKAQRSDLSPEELLRRQQELFAGAKERLNAERGLSM